MVALVVVVGGGEVGDVHVEFVGQGVQGLEPGGTAALLEVSHGDAVQAGQFGELLLGQALGLAGLADARADRPEQLAVTVS